MIMKPPIKVLITGATGSIAYSLIPMLASGQVYGLDQPIILHLFARRVNLLAGLAMEIEDSVYPLVKSFVVTDEESVAFSKVDSAFLMASTPKLPGMVRSDMLAANVRICAKHGKLLAKYAKPDVKVLVVCNPTNTCALVVAQNAAPVISSSNVTALTRLDHNRAVQMLAAYHNVRCSDVARVAIWGNHSHTQFPDASNVLINGQLVTVAKDSYYTHEFVDSVRQRGFAVIKARNNTSALSAAKASADHMHDWWTGTDNWVSMGVLSDDNPYGVPQELVFSFPVTVDKCSKQWMIVDNIALTDRSRNAIKVSVNELIEEKYEALNCLKS
ncbi:malate dehydrogenase, cytoplasmic-like [Oppia nitens]|uniref:malate dehydrogenase, cytoplasmic-like n=1 Tax=Oppia nitens TaxID=1686743 RepID=UPI0023DBAA05|nr:malate dehydrogenase, cytoplasmic-like [Oppia nitens]